MTTDDSVTEPEFCDIDRPGFFIVSGQYYAWRMSDTPDYRGIQSFYMIFAGPPCSTVDGILLVVSTQSRMLRPVPHAPRQSQCRCI